MSIFEFLMVLLSIIIGLSIAEILTGFADSLSSKREQKFPWLHTLFSLGLFLVSLQVWWESWELRLLDQWAFTDLVLMVSIPVLLFVISRILNPGRDYAGNLDDYYLKNASKIYILLGIAVLIGNSFRSILYGAPLFIVDNLTAVPLLIIAIILGLSKNKTIHKILLAIIISLILLDVLLINLFIS